MNTIALHYFNKYKNKTNNIMQTFINILVIILFIDRFIIHFENNKIIHTDKKEDK